MKIGSREFIIGKRTYIMAILNITPDSFSDGGLFITIDAAIERAKKMVKEGADIIDIGGESTRPGHIQLTAEEEIKRVAPIIEALRKEIDVPISIDTWKASVAEMAIKVGASMVNDIWGLKKDKEISKVIKKYNVPCCLMHNREQLEYKNLINDMKIDINESLQIAKAAGIAKENIMLDPGIGFAKNLEQNMEVMRNLESLREIGYPLLLGTSRKSMIGLTLELPVNERVEGTLATTVIGIMKGIDFVRVHDVKENKRTAMMADAIIRNNEYQ
ncbi:MAG: dihydropteroate synthase [Firmicutes bacterium HGW-Firmicutes-7]|nr:MAG: dihydropteroate synthase [Firmicutes bacterium HGW-Firmicutes-7]